MIKPDRWIEAFAEAGFAERVHAPILKENAARLTKPELRQLLGYETRGELDGFLKAHGVFEEYTLEDLEQERRDLKSLGL